MRLQGPLRTGGHLFKIALKLGQAVQLLQSQRGCRWRIFGPGAKAVPAPKITLAADQSLSGQQRCLQTGADIAVDQPNLPHPAAKHTGRFDVDRQGRDASGQCLRIFVGRQNHPTRRPVCANFRRPQIIGQSGANGLFQPRFNNQQVKHLMACLGFAFHQLGQGGNFGTQGGGFALGFGPHGARFGFASLHFGTGGFG